MKPLLFKRLISITLSTLLIILFLFLCFLIFPDAFETNFSPLNNPINLYIKASAESSFNTNEIQITDPDQNPPEEPDEKPEPIPEPTPEPIPEPTPEPTPEPYVEYTYSVPTPDPPEETIYEDITEPIAETPAETPAEVPPLTITLEDTTLIGFLPLEAIIYTQNENILMIRFDNNFLNAAIQSLKTTESQNATIKTIQLKLPVSPYTNISQIDLFLNGTLVSTLNNQNISLELTQEETSIKLPPHAFNADTYPLFQPDNELKYSLTYNTKELITPIKIYNEPGIPLSQVFSINTSIINPDSSESEIKQLKKGLIITQHLSNEIQSNLSNTTIIMVCSYYPNTSNYKSIHSQYNKEDSLLNFTINQSGDYFLASRSIVESTSFNRLYFIVPLVLIGVGLLLYFFIYRSSKQKQK